MDKNKILKKCQIVLGALCASENTTEGIGAKHKALYEEVTAALTHADARQEGYREGLRKAALTCRAIALRPSDLWEEKGCWAHAAEHCAEEISALTQARGAGDDY